MVLHLVEEMGSLVQGVDVDQEEEEVRDLKPLHLIQVAKALNLGAVL